MIERLHGKGEMSEDRPVLYVCNNPEFHTYVSLELKKQRIPLDHIHFKRLVEIKGYPNPDDMFPSLIAAYDTIFVDEAEDLSNALDKATNLDIPTKKSYFWIFFITFRSQQQMQETQSWHGSRLHLAAILARTR